MLFNSLTVGLVDAQPGPAVLCVKPYIAELPCGGGYAAANPVQPRSLDHIEGEAVAYGPRAQTAADNRALDGVDGMIGGGVGADYSERLAQGVGKDELEKKGFQHTGIGAEGKILHRGCPADIHFRIPTRAADLL